MLKLKTWRNTCLRLSLGGLVLLCATTALAGSVLTEQRAAQRTRVKTASLKAAADGIGAPFGLLVIPVDFADRRLPLDWSASGSLGSRLTGGDKSLRNYFDIASGGRFDLRVTMAPLVRLPGDRADYADGPPPNGGFPRTRDLARLALESVRDSGLPLRLLDMDGPDGLAGTEDDDGWVDGVLILHAGDGLENGGVVMPLQYYLEEAVVGDGVAASSYAVASMHSGLGIWVHETGHLLGLEERYDRLLTSEQGDSEIHSRGGLGIFSGMAAGAWGTGGGTGCALPDAYSGWQLGWYDALDLPRWPADGYTLQSSVTSRQVVRIWTHGIPSDEFFLLEVRDPAAAAPFDAAVPGGSLVITHVDERVPDGGFLENGDGSWRLRVRLVEADGNEDVRNGLDEGSAADLFPGTLGIMEFTPTTSPNSDGWSGPSLVAVSDINAADGAVGFTVSADDGPAVAFDLAVADGPGAAVTVTVHSLGAALGAPTGRLTAGIPSHGSFAGGMNFVDLVLVETSPGLWVPDVAPIWEPDPVLPLGAATRFILRVADGGWQSDLMVTTWHWDANGDAFDFATNWPGDWVSDRPDGNLDTNWMRWDMTAGPVLICTGANHTADDWPDVRYWPRAHATLTTPAAGPGVTALRIVHAWDAETLPTGEGMDGGTLDWVAPDGSTRAAEPVDGWPGYLAATSTMALHGRGGFTGAMEVDANHPLWQVDLVPVPTDGPGPWRLRFSFAANGIYNSQRGWLIAEVRPQGGPAAEQALPVTWTGSELQWMPPAEWTAPGDVEILENGTWHFFAPGQPGLTAATARAPLTDFPGAARSRHLVRVVGPLAAASMATRPVVIYPDGGDPASPFLGLPWPNPAREEIRFLLEVPRGQNASLRIYDVRGRLLREESHPTGSHLLSWDGTTRGGRRVAAGTYFLRVDGPTGSRSHKVVFLH